MVKKIALSLLIISMFLYSKGSRIKYNNIINDKYLISPNSLKLDLMSKYSRDHYGENLIYLNNPQIIVIHSTETPNLDIALYIFKHDTLIGRSDIEYGGEVNVGTHFLIDIDGTIYSSTPLEYIARHTIGFNHTAISIENIGYAGRLTEEQLDSNVKLIKYLKSRFNSIKYIIGHYEYNNIKLPHYSLNKELNKKYIQTFRYDPGTNFMERLKRKIY